MLDQMETYFFLFYIKKFRYNKNHIPTQIEISTNDFLYLYLLLLLYSLFYLFEYVQRPANISPTDFIRYIKQRRGHFNEKTLLQFWCNVLKNKT